MTLLLVGLAWLGTIVRVGAVVLSTYALVIWLTERAARRGTLSPYGSFARTVRRIGDPYTRRIERWVLRQGGVPSAAAGWGVAFAIGGSLVAIWAVQFLGSIVMSVGSIGSAGPYGLLRAAVDLIFQILFIALMIRVLGSWVGLSPYSRIGRVVGVLTDWLLDPLRRLVPPIGGTIDLTPIIAYFLLQVARGALLRALL